MESVNETASNTITLISHIRTGNNALCLLDVHSFLLKSPANKVSKQFLNRLAQGNKANFKHTSEALHNEAICFAAKASHQRRNPLAAIRTPCCLVEIIREYLRHFQVSRKNSVKNTLDYQSLKAQARAFANVFSETFPDLWRDSDVDVRSLLVQVVEEYPIVGETTQNITILEMQQKVAQSKGKRCRISNPDLLRDLLSTAGAGASLTFDPN
jgi:hypothetical protein